ncbi:hypothetical protein [Bradyrhizobium pachyrhizi]|uniref:hypothetical protein n=1 Tax=Bradyrhizobium pachyrhizi TaxID=280333 RepID=UPI003D3626BA
MLDELRADVDAAFTGELRTGTLLRVLPGMPDGAGGTLPGETVSYPFEGVKSNWGIVQAGVGGVPHGDARIEVLASSLATEPVRLDTINIEGGYWLVREISRDPSGTWFELQCESVSAPA